MTPPDDAPADGAPALVAAAGCSWPLGLLVVAVVVAVVARPRRPTRQAERRRRRRRRGRDRGAAAPPPAAAAPPPPRPPADPPRPPVDADSCRRACRPWPSTSRWPSRSVTVAWSRSRPIEARGDGAGQHRRTGAAGDRPAARTARGAAVPGRRRGRPRLRRRADARRRRSRDASRRRSAARSAAGASARGRVRLQRARRRSADAVTVEVGFRAGAPIAVFAGRGGLTRRPRRPAPSGPALPGTASSCGGLGTPRPAHAGDTSPLERPELRSVTVRGMTRGRSSPIVFASPWPRPE